MSTILINGLPSDQSGAASLVSGPWSGVSQLGGGATRRRTVNGDMRIDQVNGGALVSIAAAALTRSAGADKFNGFGSAAAGVFSMQQQAGGPNGFTNFLRATVTTLDAAPVAGSIYLIDHRIEGTYCQDLQFGIAANGQSVALGFWVRCSLTGQFSGSLGNSAANRSYPFTFTIPTANVWTFISVVVPVDAAGVWVISAASYGIALRFDLGSGATFRGAAGAWSASNLFGVTGAVRLISTLAATFDITGVQLEPGTGATLFEQWAFETELQRCQREFCKSFNIATAPATNIGLLTGENWFNAIRAGALLNFYQIWFPVIMRATPAMLFFNPAAANAQMRDVTGAVDCSLTGASTNLTERQSTITATGNAATAVPNLLAVHWTADSRL